MTAFAVAPYTHQTRPFAIGLKPWEDAAPWLIVDEHYERYVDEKRRLLDERADQVFGAEDDTIEAQAECLATVLTGLAADHPGLIGDDGETLACSRTGRRFVRADWTDRPLALAGLLVQEDLVLMRKRATGWSLAAGFVAFPSSWSLREKFARPLSEIHAPVPGLTGRPTQIIERIFDNLAVDQPVFRQNWSLYDDDRLDHPSVHGERTRDWLRTSADPLDLLFVRVEHQTLRKLPQSGDILFTVRIVIDPLSAMATHPRSASLASGLFRQLSEMSADELIYKGLQEARPAILARLADLIPEQSNRNEPNGDNLDEGELRPGDGSGMIAR